MTTTNITSNLVNNFKEKSLPSVDNTESIELHISTHNDTNNDTIELKASTNDKRELLQKQLSNKTKGDSIECKENKNIRIMFQNINSLRPQKLGKMESNN